MKSIKYLSIIQIHYPNRLTIVEKIQQVKSPPLHEEPAGFCVVVVVAVVVVVVLVVVLEVVREVVL